jgi:hypothetical protein
VCYRRRFVLDEIIPEKVEVLSGDVLQPVVPQLGDDVVTADTFSRSNAAAHGKEDEKWDC